MKKFFIDPTYLGKKITGKVGVVILTEDTTQKDLKKLHDAGFTDVVKVKAKKEEPKEELKDEPKED